MRILLGLILTFFLTFQFSYATLTPGYVPVTKTGGANPVVQNGSIYDTGTASGAGNVGIGTTNPGVRLDVQGTVRDLGTITTGNITATIAVTGGTKYNVKECDSLHSFCAKGDGIELVDGIWVTTSANLNSSSATFTSADVGKVISLLEAGTMTGGGNNTDGVTSTSTDFNSAAAAFTTTNIGDVIVISGAGAAGADLTTTIAAFVSATEVTLTTATSNTASGVTYRYGIPADLTTTISAFVDADNVTLTATPTTGSNATAGQHFVYGTDDTTPWQTCLTLIGTNKQGTCFGPAGTYIINGAFQNAANQNAQLALPISGTSPIIQYTIGIEGESLQSPPDSVSAYIAPITNGTILYSTRNGTGNPQTVIGGNPGASTFNSAFLFMKNITIRTTSNPNLVALKETFMGGLTLEGVFVDAAGLDGAHAVRPTYTTSYGIQTPQHLNGAWTVVDKMGVVGFYNGYLPDEHANSDNIVLNGNYNGLVLATGSGQHSMNFGRILIQDCPIEILISNQTTFNMANLSVEHWGGTGWRTLVADISDPSSFGNGIIKWERAGASSLTTVTGGSKLQIESLFAPFWLDVQGTTTFAYGNNYVFPTQNVGIGTVGVPHNLYVVGSANGQEGIFVQNKNTNTNAGTVVEVINNANATGFLGQYNSNSGPTNWKNYTVLVGGTSLILNSDANVSSGGTSGMAFQTGGFSANPTMVIGGGNPGNVGIGTSTALQRFNIGGPTTPFVVTSTGNVGINSLTPGINLDIQGSVRIFSATSSYTKKSGANTACNSTCAGSMCIFGEDTGVIGTLLSCTDATADVCICAGP